MRIRNKLKHLYHRILFCIKLGLLLPTTFASPWASVTGCPPPSGKPIGLRLILFNIAQSFNAIANLLGAAAYVGGVGFTAAGIVKFKQHRDNPAQVSIATPITYITIGALLVFLPNLIQLTRQSIFTQTNSDAGRIRSLDSQFAVSSRENTIYPSDC